jgi:EthD domain
MAKAMFLAWSDPVDDVSESEFNTWYEGTHIPQVRAAVTAITAVHRYRVADLPADANGSPTHRYLAVYEMDTDDVQGAVAALGAAASAGQIDMSPTLDTAVNPPVLQWYQAVAG